MPIVLDNGEEGLRVILDPTLTIYNVAETREALLSTLQTDVTVTVDVSPIEECDTAGLQLLLMLQKSVRARGGHCQFVGQNEVMQELLSMLHLQSTFDIAATRELPHGS